MSTYPLNPLGSANPGGGGSGGVGVVPGAIGQTGVVNPGTVVNPTTATTANPYASPQSTGSVPTLSAANNGLVGTGGSTTQTPGINWADGSNTVTGDFKDTYGAGTGTAITDVLQGLGTATDSAVQATIANTNLAAGQQYGNIQAQEAAGGVTPNSSTAALAAGDFYSNVNSQLQQTVSGMELGEENTLLGALTNEGSAHGSDTSTWDSITSALGSIVPGVSSAANAINSTSATGTGTLSSILDAVGELG